jgi:hypothetical protein
MSGPTRATLARVVMAIVGLALVTLLVRSAGPSKVAHVLADAAPWLPLVYLLEVAQLATDVIGLRWLLRTARPVPAVTWLRSSAAAYGMMILLPAGRVAGEVTRGALLSQHVGAPWAATAAAQLQASYLFANGVLSGAACIAIATWAGPTSPLVFLLAGNALLMWTLSGSILAVLRGERAGRFIERVRHRFAKSVAPSPPLEPEARRLLPWRAVLSCVASRSAQVVQYGVLVAAVGGVASVRNAFIAHGIHLVGSTLGDVLPNQLGVVDGAYRAFASTIGLGDAPARALSIAFLAHTVQLTCAAGCILVVALARRAAPLPGELPAAETETTDRPGP